MVCGEIFEGQNVAVGQNSHAHDTKRLAEAAKRVCPVSVRPRVNDHTVANDHELITPSPWGGVLANR